jgi:putative oxidoreductase
MIATAATSPQVDTALLLLRVVFGVFFAIHGINKVRSGIAGTTAWFAGIGMKWPGLQARMAAGTEILAGVALAVGLLTPLAGAAVLGVMVVATWTAHRTGGFFIYNNGWEYTVSIGIVGIALGISGPGRFSLDRVLGWELSNWSGAVIVLALGFLAGIGQLIAFYRPPSQV